MNDKSVMDLVIDIQTNINIALENKIVDDVQKAIVQSGYEIVIDKDELVKMLKMYKNDPLSFDELKPGMWCWNNRRKRYFKIMDVFIRGNEKIYSWFDSALGITVYHRFVQGHLYRYEVER